MNKNSSIYLTCLISFITPTRYHNLVFVMHREILCNCIFDCLNLKSFKNTTNYLNRTKFSHEFANFGLFHEILSCENAWNFWAGIKIHPKFLMPYIFFDRKTSLNSPKLTIFRFTQIKSRKFHEFPRNLIWLE